MFLFYVLCFAVVPIIIISRIRPVNNNVDGLIDKDASKLLRGVSAIFIIEAHYLLFAKELGGQINKFAEVIISQLGGIGVLIFFFISGYGVYISYIDKEVNWKYWSNRLTNVYIPYVLIKSVMLIVKIILGYEIENIGRVIWKIITLEDWFVAVIFLQYLSFFIFWKIKKNWIIRGGILADIFYSIIFIWEHKPLGWFNALWLFTVGMIFAKYYQKISTFFKDGTVIKIFLALIGFGVTGGLFAAYKGEIFFINIFKPISGIFLCIAICGLLQKVHIRTELIGHVGECSLYYYIVHLQVWELTYKISDLEKRIWASIILTVLVAECLYMVITRMINLCGKYMRIKNVQRGTADKYHNTGL